LQLTVCSQVVETVYIVSQILHVFQDLLEYKAGISYTVTVIMCVFMWKGLSDYVGVYVNKTYVNKT